MQCKFCGNENNDNAVSCYICGKSLVSNIATSLVDIGSVDTENTFALNGNDAYTNRFASDTGGGPSIGPQRSFGSQIISGETTKSGGIGGVALVVILLIIAAVAVWFLFYSANAPFTDMLPEALRFGKAVSASDAVGAPVGAPVGVPAPVGAIAGFFFG